MAYLKKFAITTACSEKKVEIKYPKQRFEFMLDLCEKFMVPLNQIFLVESFRFIRQLFGPKQFFYQF